MRALKVFTAATIFNALIASAALQTANANVIVGSFGGTLNQGFDTATDHPGATLGISNGDTFSGSFEYDSITGNPLSFEATVAGADFVVQQPQVRDQLFDGLLTYWSIIGQLSNGLYMSVGLTNGSPVFTSLPPQSLSSNDWFLVAFEIRSSSVPPVEVDCCGKPAISAVYGGPRSSEDFFLRTVSVPEPNTVVMFLIGFGGLACVGFARLGRKA